MACYHCTPNILMKILNINAHENITFLSIHFRAGYAKPWNMNMPCSSPEKEFKFKIKCFPLIWFVITFLKYSRVHEMLPKHLITAGSCAMIKMVGSMRWILVGNRYQSNWFTSSSMSSNFPAIVSPISQELKTIITDQNPQTINSSDKAKSKASCDCKKRHYQLQISKRKLIQMNCIWY